MELVYFFDTYAFFEFILGNKNYKKYFEQTKIFTSVLNLTELFYVLLNNYDLETARKYYYSFKQFVIPLSDEIIEKAMIFRHDNKKKDLSYADCIGYTIAQKQGIKFLTGDKEFKDMGNVEFVK
jgi:uncharacterized protein